MAFAVPLTRAAILVRRGSAFYVRPLMTPPITGIVLYVKYIPRVSAFYQAHFGFTALPSGLIGLQQLVSPSGGCGLTLHQAAKSQQSGDTLGVLMPEATFRRRATEDWIGLSALDYSWCWNLGRGPQAGIKAGLWPWFFAVFGGIKPAYYRPKDFPLKVGSSRLPFGLTSQTPQQDLVPPPAPRNFVPSGMAEKGHIPRFGDGISVVPSGLVIGGIETRH